MPVFPVFADAALGPARTRVMGEAFDRAIGLLDIAPLKIVQEVMAAAAEPTAEAQRMAPVGSGRRPCGSRGYARQAVAVEAEAMKTLDIAALLGDCRLAYWRWCLGNPQRGTASGAAVPWSSSLTRIKGAGWRSAPTLPGAPKCGKKGIADTRSKTVDFRG
jgi:hypothetical protein